MAPVVIDGSFNRTAQGGGTFNAGILKLEHSKDTGNSAPVGADLYYDSTGWQYSTTVWSASCTTTGGQ